MLNLRKNAIYDLVVPTSMGLRMTPINHQPVNTATTYELQATSAESNVLSVCASLGLRTKVLTAFVKDHPFSSFIKTQLRARNIGYDGKVFDANGPWGNRHQINIADRGFGVRGAMVTNDRSGEVAANLQTTDFDLDKLFRIDGVKIVHISGLFAAVSLSTAKLCLEIAKIAKENGTIVSFDVNYRASFWKNRQEQLQQTFIEIAQYADILMGNEEDFQLALGIEKVATLQSSTQEFMQLGQLVLKRFPNVKVLSTTLRVVLSASKNLWGAMLFDGMKWIVEEPREIEIYDRIGGGDGFASGMLYAILKEYPSEQWMQLGWACGAYVVTLANDFVQIDSEDILHDVYRGNARVKR